MSEVIGMEMATRPGLTEEQRRYLQRYPRLSPVEAQGVWDGMPRERSEDLRRAEDGYRQGDSPAWSLLAMLLQTVLAVAVLAGASLVAWLWRWRLALVLVCAVIAGCVLAFEAGWRAAGPQPHTSMEFHWAPAPAPAPMGDYPAEGLSVVRQVQL